MYLILYVNVKRCFRWEKRRGQAFLIAEKTFTAENAENAEGFILKQRATTTNIGGQAFLIGVIGENGGREKHSHAKALR